MSERNDDNGRESTPEDQTDGLRVELPLTPEIAEGDSGGLSRSGGRAGGAPGNAEPDDADTPLRDPTDLGREL